MIYCKDCKYFKPDRPMRILSIVLLFIPVLGWLFFKAVRSSSIEFGLCGHSDRIDKVTGELGVSYASTARLYGCVMDKLNEPCE